MRSRFRTGLTALLAALLALLAGCASPYARPPSAGPLTPAAPAGTPDYARLLPGTWRLVSELESLDSKTVLPNVIDRQADLAGIDSWKTFQFTPQGELLLSAGAHHDTLYWKVHHDRLTLHLKGALENDQWQITWSDGSLFLRSLSDSDTYTLERAGGSGMRGKG